MYSVWVCANCLEAIICSIQGCVTQMRVSTNVFKGRYKQHTAWCDDGNSVSVIRDEELTGLLTHLREAIIL